MADTSRFETLARVFKVSPIVTSRRALDLNREESAGVLLWLLSTACRASSKQPTKPKPIYSTIGTWLPI